MASLEGDRTNRESHSDAGPRQSPQANYSADRPSDDSPSRTSGLHHVNCEGHVDNGQPSTTEGLAPNIAAMLSYLLFGWIGGLIMYLTQKDREVRFHAAQSILTFGGLTIILFGVDIGFGIAFVYTGFFIMGLGWLISLLSFALWIFLSIQGYQLKHIKLPIVGSIAEQWARK